MDLRDTTTSCCVRVPAETKLDSRRRSSQTSFAQRRHASSSRRPPMDTSCARGSGITRGVLWAVSGAAVDLMTSSCVERSQRGLASDWLTRLANNGK